MSMAEENTSISLEWFDVIVAMLSLIESIDAATVTLESGKLDDDDAYELEERLNDYRTLLLKLKIKYMELPEKSELPESLSKRLSDI